MTPEEQLYLTDLQARLTQNPALVFTKEWSLARQWLYDKGLDQVITNAYQKLPKELKDKIPYKMLPTSVRAGRVQRLTAEAMDKAGKVVYNTAMTATAVPGIIAAPAATVGGLVLGAAGGYGGSKAGGYIGEKFGGEEGRKKGELYGGLIGGFAGGAVGGYVGNWTGGKFNTRMSKKFDFWKPENANFRGNNQHALAIENPNVRDLVNYNYESKKYELLYKDASPELVYEDLTRMFLERQVGKKINEVQWHKASIRQRQQENAALDDLVSLIGPDDWVHVNRGGTTDWNGILYPAMSIDPNVGSKIWFSKGKLWGTPFAYSKPGNVYILRSNKVPTKGVKFGDASGKTSSLFSGETPYLLTDKLRIGTDVEHYKYNWKTGKFETQTPNYNKNSSRLTSAEIKGIPKHERHNVRFKNYTVENTGEFDRIFNDENYLYHVLIDPELKTSGVNDYVLFTVGSPFITPKPGDYVFKIPFNNNLNMKPILHGRPVFEIRPNGKVDLKSNKGSVIKFDDKSQIWREYLFKQGGTFNYLKYIQGYKK